MDLIVISSPQELKDEGKLVNELFTAGMKRFHLRKPNISSAKLRQLLAEVEPAYRHEVVLHQHHELAGSFGLSRRHFPEALRLLQAEEITQLQQSGSGLSTSVHRLDDAEDLKCFEYVFFGPVFNSISKPGYQSALPINFCLPARTAAPKIIALGGIDTSNIDLVKAMNFDGIAVLGAIWNKGSSPVSNFLSIRECLSEASESNLKILKHD